MLSFIRTKWSKINELNAKFAKCAKAAMEISGTFFSVLHLCVLGALCVQSLELRVVANVRAAAVPGSH